MKNKDFIIYDGIYDLSAINEENMIAYTSFKTHSSSAMDKNEFSSNYKIVKSKVMCLNCIGIEVAEMVVELNGEISDLILHIEKQDLKIAPIRMGEAFMKQYETCYGKPKTKDEKKKQYNWVYEKMWDVTDARATLESTFYKGDNCFKRDDYNGNNKL